MGAILGVSGYFTAQWRQVDAILELVITAGKRGCKIEIGGVRADAEDCHIERQGMTPWEDVNRMNGEAREALGGEIAQLVAQKLNVCVSVGLARFVEQGPGTSLYTRETEAFRAMNVASVRGDTVDVRYLNGEVVTFSVGRISNTAVLENPVRASATAASPCRAQG